MTAAASIRASDSVAITTHAQTAVPIKNRGTRAEFHSAYKRWKETSDLSGDLRPLIDLASAHLKAQKIKHALRLSASGHWTIVITPTASDKRNLGSLAHTLWKRHRTKLVYDPARLARQKAVATYRRPIRGRDHGLIQLPTVSVLYPKSIDPSLAHEIVHSLTTWRLAQGKPYAFYGRVTALKAKRLPYNGLVDKHGKRHLTHSYATGFSFDEIDAYLSQVSALIRRAEGAASAAKRRKLTQKAATRALRGYKLAVQSSIIAGEALAQLNDKKLSVRYKPYGTLRQARLTLTAGARTVAVKLPLFQKQTVRSQLLLLKTSAIEKSVIFYGLLERLAPETAEKFHPHAA